jgi:hypothetical protein
VDGGNLEDCECLGNVLLEPCGELRRGLVVARDRIPQPPLCLSDFVSGQDATETPGRLRSHSDLQHVGDGVLDRMELTAPRA